MKTLVIINGQGGVGKDTFVDLCAINSEEKTYSFSSIAPIKILAKKLGWNDEKDEKSRKFLSDLKKLSADYNSFPTHYLIYSIERVPEENALIFVHIREPNQIKEFLNTIQEEFSNIRLFTLLLAKTDVSSLAIGNESDENVYEYEYDFFILNDGTLQELEIESRNFLKFIGIPNILKC